MENLEPPRFLRLPEVMRQTGLARATIYQLGREGKFPRRVKLTPRASAWRENEIADWIKTRSTAFPA